MKNTIKKNNQKILTTIILVAVFFFGVPGIELLPQKNSALKNKNAEAAIDYGRESRTAEFVLALGSDITSRATAVPTYTTATGWVTSVPAVTSGDAIKIFGKNIHVDSAQLEVGYFATAVAVSKQDIYLNVENSSTSGGLVAAGEYLGMSATTLSTGGLTGHARTLHDVTSFFDRQTDANFLSGVNVVAGITVAGPAHFLTSMKLVVTYSVDVEAISHDLVKTVRLPLLSASDRGTRASTCAASATCAFTFDLTKIPELTSKTQIVSVGVEMFAQQGATTASSAFSLRMTGSGTSRLYTAAETYTDSYTTRVLWNPLSDSSFTVGGVESIDVVNGTIPLYGLGGEVAITFSFDANSSLQTDTVKYFVSQGTVLPVANTTQLSTSTINISNKNTVISTAWYHVDISPSVATANFAFTHRVDSSLGNSAGTQITYTLNNANARSANTMTLVHVLDESSSMYSPSMDLGGQYKFSVTAGSAPAAVAAYVTFTWDASDILAKRTKTVVFGASQKGPGRNAANNVKTASTVISLAEHSEKTHESVYLETSYTRFDTTSITGSGNFTSIVGSNLFTIPEGAIVEPHRKTLLRNISYTEFFGASTSTAQSFPFTVAQYYSGADFAYQANYIVITYSVAFQIRPEATAKQMRTVEYILGGGTDTTARATNATVYFGENTIGTSPSMLPIQLLGSGVRVKHAYVDVSFMMVASAVAQTTNDLTILGSITGYSGTEPDVYMQESSAPQFISTPSGITGYYHGQHDVTALFGKQIDDGYWNRGDVQVKFGIASNQSTGNRTLTSMKLVVTYETDFSLGWHDEIKTVRMPLQSSDSLGTRAATCTMGSNCNFTYSRSIPDLSNVVSAYFDVTASMDGTSNPSIYLASGGAQSPNFIATEANNDSTAIRYLWQIPVANLNAVSAAGQTGTLTFHNGSASALNFYGIGGELVITYRYNTASPSQLETVSYPVGQQLTGVAAKTSIGTATPYIANSGAVVRDAWLKFYSAPYATGNITLYGKLGAATERSISAASTVSTRSGGERTYFLNLSADAGSYTMPSTNITANVAFTSGAQYPTGAEAFLNYVWDGSKSGTTTRTIQFSAAQHSATNVSANAAQVKQSKITLPDIVPKIFRGAYSRTRFQQSAGGTYGGTFALGPAITFGINNATSSITALGDLSPYNNILIRSYTQSNLFGTTMPSYANNVRVENSAQAVNPFRFSNEILISYDESQELRRAAFTQDAFRLFMNIDNLTPSNPWHTDMPNPLGESQGMTATSRPVRKSDVVRLRVGLTVGTSTLESSSQAFQLQYGAQTSSCSAIDIDWQNVTTGAAWAGYSNATIYSNSPIPSLSLSKANVAGLYSEDGLTVVNPNAVNMGQMVEYDWSLVRNTAIPDTSYCFRVVESSGKKLSGYSFYPVIHTAGYTPETTNFKWFDDELHETPADNPLWLINQTALSIENNNILKMRIGLQEVANESGANEKFALQWSTDPTFVSSSEFVTLQGLCTQTSTFCYADSPSLGDDDNSILSTSKFGILKGRHNEATTTSTFSPAANSHYEMEYSIKPIRQRTGQTYYFRLWDTKRSVPVNIKSTYSSPSLTSEGSTLGVNISGVIAGTTIAGKTMSASTTNSTLPFGKLILDTSTFLSHLLNIKTNAMDGYSVRILANDELRNGGGDIIPSISASNNVPKTWSESCTVQSIGCIGYHTTDATLDPTGDEARFGIDDSWAELATTTPAEVAFGNLPTGTSGEDVNVVYRVEPHMSTAPGEYSTSIIYIITPVY